MRRAPGLPVLPGSQRPLLRVVRPGGTVSCIQFARRQLLRQALPRTTLTPFIRRMRQLWPTLGVPAALHAGPVAVELQPDAAVPGNPPPQSVQQQPRREDRCESAAVARDTGQAVVCFCLYFFLLLPSSFFSLSDCGFSRRPPQSGEGGDLLLLLPRHSDSGLLHQHRRVLPDPRR